MPLQDGIACLHIQIKSKAAKLAFDLCEKKNANGTSLNYELKILEQKIDFQKSHGKQNPELLVPQSTNNSFILSFWLMEPKLIGTNINLGIRIIRNSTEWH